MRKTDNVRQTYRLFILLLAGFFIAGCGGKTGHWLPGGEDSTAPTVTLVDPANGATNVPTGNRLTATFSEAMDPATIDTTTFTVSDGETTVPGAVTYSGVTAVFTPTSPLSNSTTYFATITTGARDLAGNALANNYAWSFRTGVLTTADSTRPRVSRTINANGATGVPINTKVGATFSEAMDPTTITTTTFTLRRGATLVPGAVAYSGVNAVFTPTSPLALSTLYTARITTGATDLAGNALAGNQASLPAASDYVWSWTTSATADNTAPRVILTYPVDNATNVAINSAVTATFSEAMDPLTISTATFTVTDNVGASVAGTVVYLDNIATFTPTDNLAAGTRYTAMIDNVATDLSGNHLVVPAMDNLPKPNPWTFTTGAGLAPSGAALGSASTFGTFGGSAGMTNQGTLTIINGNIGTIAVGTSAVTGFHDAADIYTQTPSNIGGVNGFIYTCTVSTTGPTSTGVNSAYCAIATQARLDAVDAYNALALMPSTGVLAGNLAGTTITPGVYTNSSSVLIEGGDLTLDAGGDANAVFVFQIGSTLTVGGPGAAFPQSIILAGNAQPKNIFWQVGTAATINAAGGGTMVGTIIAQDGVTFSTAGRVEIVTLEGRALSLVASVTMVNTVINVPAP
jgi:hypothetical protein